jgi:hypothetical protein
MLLNDIHHLAFLTKDMDRLTAFYATSFEAWVRMDVERVSGMPSLRLGHIPACSHFKFPASSRQVPSRCSSAGASISLRGTGKEHNPR